MPKFTRVKPETTQVNNKKGTVVVKVYLQDPKKQAGFPVPGNIKKDIAVNDATVADVIKEIEATLFGEDVEPDDTEIRYND